VNEAFNKVTKEKLNQLGGHKHCWRIDKLVYHLMSTIMDAHVMKMQMSMSGVLLCPALDMQVICYTFLDEHHRRCAVQLVCWSVYIIVST
jgi:hypothetical protein